MASTFGGGISIQNGALLSIINCLFGDNHADGKKGHAIYSDIDSSIKKEEYVKYLGRHSGDVVNVYVEKKTI